MQDITLIRLEFWNGQLDKKGQLVKTKHNPCLWTNIGVEQKPWRAVYKEAGVVLEKYFRKELSDTDFLHHLRYVAYGLGKREFDDKEVVWWGNMKEKHRPQLVVEQAGQKYTIYFEFLEGQWKARVEKDKAQFYWPL